MQLDPDIQAFYERGAEAERLSGGLATGPLELARTQELIQRHLPGSDLRILDVGGGPGVYARWLGALGHDVVLVDPVVLHVEQARETGVRAELGDARRLDQPDGSVDAVLLLGPLYHLLDADDRAEALREAHRVLRPGGLLFAAAISRYAALLDLLVRLDALGAAVFEIVAEGISTGVFRGGREVFTNAYFHLPSELAREVVDAGFGDVEVFNVEGPGFLAPDIAERWADPARRQILLSSARLVEREPELLGAASHLLAVARVPDTRD